MCNCILPKDIRIISALTNTNDNDLIPLSVYLQDTTDRDEVEEDGRKANIIKTLLDTGALGIDGNYITSEVANLIDSDKSNRHISNDITICSGLDGSCSNANFYMYLTVKIKQHTFITLKFYILESSPIDMIIGKQAIVKYNLLSMFPAQFGLLPEHSACVECNRFGIQSQCMECTPSSAATGAHSDTSTSAPSTTPPAAADQTTEMQTESEGQSLTTSSGTDVAISLSNVTPQSINNISSIINGITESSDTADSDSDCVDIEYLSDEVYDSLTREHATFLTIASISVPVGSSRPEQLALEAIAQGIFLKRLDQPVERRQLSSMGAVSPEARGRSSEVGSLYMAAVEVMRKEEFLTNLGEDDYDDYIDPLVADSYTPFASRPQDDINKLDKITYGGNERLNAGSKALCEEFSDIFSMTLPEKPAKLPPFHIKVNYDKWEDPKNRLPPRVQSQFKNSKIHELTTELLNNGVVQHSQAEYYSQAVLAPKPHTNKKEWRFCQDFRNLNDETEFQSFPLPNTSHMFDRIGSRKPKFFGVLDLTQGFHQIALTKESRRLTAFITYSGLYEYTRVPFGLKGAPPYFQQCIARIVLKDLLYVICELYIDDIIVYGETEEEFLENLRKIFERFREYEVVVKPSKVKLGLTKIEYVGLYQ